MTKNLLLLILLLFFFAGAYAQDTNDTVSKRVHVDTIRPVSHIDTVKGTGTDSAKVYLDPDTTKAARSVKDVIKKVDHNDTLKSASPIDSIKKIVHTDTVKNTPPPDSLAKKQLMETVRGMPSDSVLRQRRTDFLKKQTADSLARLDRLKSADSLVKKMAVDSLLKQSRTDSVTQQKPIENIQRVPHADSVTKKDSIAKPAVIKVPVKRATADSIGHSQKGKPVVAKPVVPDATKHSTVKTLSDKKYLGYLNGDDMDDMSLVGEMNHYPSPDKALKYKAQIQLNPGQIAKLKEIVTNLNRKKKEMGQNIISNERTLDTLFKTRQIVDGTIIFYTNRYGLYLGELRNAILQACFKTQDILSDVQIRKLESLEKTGQ